MERQCVTRFNPSCNASLHLGHLYTILVNEHYAHSRGGRFLVRFDDSHPSYRKSLGDRINRVREHMREDIEWLGVPVDEWHSQWEWAPRIEEELRRVGFADCPVRIDDSGPTCVWKRGVEIYRPWPHDTRLTAEHVVTDHLMGVTDVIRGEDLLTEYCMYQYLCDEFKYPRPKHVYLPRLRGLDGEISKTAGSTTVAEYRARGHTPEEIKGALCEGSLIHLCDPWCLENLRVQPVVVL
jgi:glutamyl/glutaminyl-tRNA synthetase